MFVVEPYDSLRFQIINDFSANSHFDFFLENPNPLWMNPDFFIHFPFKKKRKDVNPTKASHREMNPKHLALAKQEISTLLTKGPIEPTSSPCACEAFYVNKHDKQIRGKLKLVINY